MESPTGAWALMWAASLVAVAGFVVALWRLPHWLAHFPLRDIVLAACTFGLAFVAITLPYQAAVVVVASALGPFMFLVEGLFYKAILFAVLGTFFTAVPRPGVYLLFYLLWMVAQALFSGWYAYGPVTLLFAGVAVASMEAALWLGGVTRGGGTRRTSVLWPAVAIGLGELAIVYWDLLLIRALYRLYLPQWFMWLEAGSAALYAAAGAAFGLRMGRVLVGLRRPPLPESPTAALPVPQSVVGVPLLEVASLSFAHAGVPVLRDVSFTLQPGQITLITGPTGCGKTTLLRLIQGLLPLEDPSAVRWCGVPRAQFSPHQWAQRSALLFQESAVQFLGTAAADEIAFGLRLAGRDAASDAVAAALAEHGLTPLAERLPQRLSGGELQQVVLASLLAGQPRMLLLDEPLAQLDDASRERLPGRLKDLARDGMAVLVTEHRTAPLLRVADHVIALDAGRIAWQGSPQAYGALRSRPRSFPDASSLWPIAPGSTSSEGALHLRSVAWRHPGADAPLIRDLSATLAPGQTVLLYGPNGAGKSTLLELLLGLRRPTAGTVMFGARSVQRMGWRDRSRVFGYLPQRADLLLHAPTVADELAVALRWRGIPHTDIAPRVTPWLDRLGLSHAAQRFPHLLSRGERQLVALGAILIAEPHVLVLDEPFAGLDPEQAARALELCRAHLAADPSHSLLVATHDVDVFADIPAEQWALREGHVSVEPAHLPEARRFQTGAAV